MKLRLRFFASLALAALLLATGASAQTVKVNVDQGPHYVGEAVSIRVTALGFEEEPAPRAAVQPPASGELSLVSVSPNVSQSITITNGRMARTREVTHVFQFRYVPAAPGLVTIGPFRLTQGGKAAGSSSARLKVQAVPTSGGIAVRMKMPSGSVFVGERVPVTVEFELEEQLGQNLLSYELRVPIFDLDDAFRLLDAGTGGDQDVVLQTAKGRINLKGQNSQVRRGGKTYTIVSFERTIVPLRTGSFELPAATLSILEGTRWQRDFFGGRRATRQRRWGAQDQARTLEVLEIPGGKKPPSYAGAIGAGFTFEVVADRTVVQVGDPIALRLTLRGEGIETAGMPALDAEGLLPAVDFRVPSVGLTGELQDDTKQFVASVRVLHEGVGEVPALAYSWFNPETQAYETTHSRPIALSVRSAEVISAADVQSVDASEAADGSARGAGSEGAPGSPGSGENGPGEDANVRARTFALTGADLAIERDLGRMFEKGRGGTRALWLIGSCYAAGLLLIPAAIVDRRRRDVDPRVTARRRGVALGRAKVEAARSLPPVEAAAAIAAALRQMLAAAPEGGSAALEELLGECDARSYAPPGQAAELDDDLFERAAEIARGFEAGA